MNSFKIDNTEFGIGEISFSIGNGVLDLEITGNDSVLDADVLDRYEIALYMMEHNDFTGSLKVTDSTIDIYGRVYIDGKASMLDISVERKGM